MLRLYYKEKDFYYENFSADEAIKVFKKDQNDISDFLLKINQNMVKNKKKDKIWKPSNFNFNRKNPMCEHIQMQTKKYNV